MSSFYNSKSMNGTLRNVKSAERNLNTKNSRFLPDELTASHTATMSRFQSSARSPTLTNREKSRIFEQISQKERYIEEAAREQKEKLRTYQRITFEHGSADRRGKGEFNSIFHPRPDSGYKPPIRKMDVSAPKSYDIPVPKARKPAPAGSQPERRDPIVHGEHAHLIKPKNKEFTASVTSQVQNFKRFFLPSEWRAATCGGSEPITKGEMRTFPSIKALLQHEYVPQKQV